MQNIQDLKEKIFFESRNIIGILDKVSHVDELSSKLDLVEELAERISFLRLLEKNIAYFGGENFSPVPENNENFYRSGENDEVTEEEAIFNNELNEINEKEPGSYSDQVTEEEAIFNNQLNEIVEEELHETLVNFAEENKGAGVQEVLNDNVGVFNDQPDENNNEPDSSKINVEPDNFPDEEKIPAESDPDDEKTEEEAVFNNQLNEIDEFENEISDNDGEILNSFEEEERILNNYESSSELEEHPAEETNDPLFSSQMMGQGEIASDTSGAENIVNDLKNESAEEEKQEESVLAEINDRRKIVDIQIPVSEEKEEKRSDESFESLEAYHAYNHDKKIKLANIRGLKAVQSLFDDDHLERELPAEKPAPAEKKEETGSILKTNIPTDFMEAEKKKPEFKLDLNDRIAFSKTLFRGSQSELNEVVAHLNSFKTLEEAKEYLSDLYYSRKWNKVDEYAQRLWILVENKFL
ncbi:hypothetical protein [uncultured Chryseobacterium sp.]|uniref:hypothetical protein n=1 Tax=uncultured Chryseobacterium sp. TaxID=259322 RepID=UPI0025EA3024|nr:hypothetical protein [uncultured Chryseobacterium sp.]